MDIQTATQMIGQPVKVKDDPSHRGGRLVAVTADGWGEIREWKTAEQVVWERVGGRAEDPGRVDAYPLHRIVED